VRETPRAQQAWADYLALGPGRSLAGLLERYQNAPKASPTTRLATLKAWSVAYGWQARLSEIADREAREAEEREAAYRREIMDSGYALIHERIQSMKRLADVLFAELTEEGENNRRWLPDVKQIGSGEHAERVDILRFNHQEVEQFRGLLDDIAKELGARKDVHLHQGDAERPITIRTITAVLPADVEAEPAAEDDT